MKKLILFIIVYAVLPSQLSVCDESINCDSAIPNRLAGICNLDRTIYLVAPLLFSYAENDITFDVFENKSANLCLDFENYLNCMDQALDTLLNDCKYSNELLNFVHDRVFAKFYCENNRERMKLIIADDGLSCKYNNYEYLACRRQTTFTPGLTQHETYCATLKQNIKCENKLDDCINPHVKLYDQELSLLLFNGLWCEME